MFKGFFIFILTLWLFNGTIVSTYDKLLDITRKECKITNRN